MRAAAVACGVRGVCFIIDFAGVCAHMLARTAQTYANQFHVLFAKHASQLAAA